MAESSVKRDNFINIQGWQIIDLKLKGNELLIYACIFGFSQNEQSFNGSLQYLADWCNSTKFGVQKCLKSLIAKGLIVKKEIYKNKVKYCEYRVSDVRLLEEKDLKSIQQSCIGYTTKLHGGIQQSCMGYTTKLHGGIQQSCTNNIVNNIENNIENNIYSAKNFAPHTQSDISDVFKALWKKYPLKRNKYKVTDEAKADMQKIGMDEMNRALDRYLTECKENSDWLQPMNGDTFFNNGYIDYLDANYTPREKPKPKPKQKQNSFNNMQLRQQYDIDAIERMNESREPTKASPEIMQRADDLKRRLAAGS